GNGRQRNHWLAAFRQRGPAHEVHLSAYTRKLVRPYRVRTNLPGKINLDSAVDGHHLRVLADDRSIVHIGYVDERDVGVVVYKIIEFPGAQGEGGDDLALADLLVLVGDHPAFD